MPPPEIFSSDLEAAPFAPAIRSRLLMFECPYVLDRARFSVLAEVASARGDVAFEAITVEPNQTPQHRARFSFGDWDTYSNRMIGLENALFSPRRTWGLLLGSFGHVCVGGSDSFADQLREGLIQAGVWNPRSDMQPPETDEVLEFLDEVDDVFAGRSVSWPSELLEHLYGSPQGRQFIELHDAAQGGGDQRSTKGTH